MRYIPFLAMLLVSSSLPAAIVENVSAIEKLDALDTPYFLPGERQADLTPQMRARRRSLQIRLDYPEAWKLYKSGEIQDFSYFGFKLCDLECGLITEEEFLRELQDYLKKFGK